MSVTFKRETKTCCPFAATGWTVLYYTWKNVLAEERTLLSSRRPWTRNLGAGPVRIQVTLTFYVPDLAQPPTRGEVRNQGETGRALPSLRAWESAAPVTGAPITTQELAQATKLLSSACFLCKIGCFRSFSKNVYNSYYEPLAGLGGNIIQSSSRRAGEQTSWQTQVSSVGNIF